MDFFLTSPTMLLVSCVLFLFNYVDGIKRLRVVDLHELLLLSLRDPQAKNQPGMTEPFIAPLLFLSLLWSPWTHLTKTQYPPPSLVLLLFISFPANQVYLLLRRLLSNPVSNLLLNLHETPPQSPGTVIKPETYNNHYVPFMLFLPITKKSERWWLVTLVC